jgi:hypothetical protein
MKNTSTHYFVQSQLGDNPTEIVGHSQDKKTKEIYYKFLERKKAVKLIEDERKLDPKRKYRVVKVTTISEAGSWS